MAWTQRGTATDIDGTGTSHVLTKPTGVVDGDLLVVCGSVLRSGSTMTPPAGGGWIEAGNVISASGTSYHHAYMWWKIAASEGASWTWASSNYACTLSCVAFQPEGTVRALECVATNGVNSAGAVYNVTGPTTHFDNELVISYFSCRYSTALTSTLSNGPTEIDDYASSSGFVSHAIGWHVKAADGAVGTVTDTWSNASAAIKCGIVAGFRARPAATQTKRWSGITRASTSTSIAVTIDASVQAGDLMIAGLATMYPFTDGVWETITPPTGWSAAQAFTTNAGNNIGVGVWTKVAVAGDIGNPATFTFSGISGAIDCTLIVHVRASAGGTDTPAVNNPNNANTPITANAVTTTGSAETLAVFVAVDGPGTVWPTAPLDMTIDQSSPNTLSYGGEALYTQEVLDASSATGTRAIAITNAGAAAIAVTLALTTVTGPSPLAAANGSFALTGKPVVFVLTRANAAGTFTLTGEPVVERVTVPHAAGSVGLTGEPVTYAVSLSLAAAAGAFSLAGQDAAVGRLSTLGVDAGSFALSGQPIASGLNRSHEAGALSLTGQSADETRGYVEACAAGSFALAGQQNAVGLAWVLANGSFALAGNAAVLTVSTGQTLIAASGGFALTGEPATFGHGITVAFAQGGFALAGEALLFGIGLTLNPATGLLGMTGEAVIMMSGVPRILGHAKGTQTWSEMAQSTQGSMGRATTAHGKPGGDR